MSNLVIEILLRLAKAGIAALIGVALYLVLVGPLAVAGSAELALSAGSAAPPSSSSWRPGFI
jgi:hypothetical protein